jgi:hypothetical protein
MITTSPKTLPRTSEGLVSTTSINCAAVVYLYDPHALLFIDDSQFPNKFVFEKRVAPDIRKYDRGESAVEPRAYTHAISQLRELVRKKQ